MIARRDGCWPLSVRSARTSGGISSLTACVLSGLLGVLPGCSNSEERPQAPQEEIVVVSDPVPANSARETASGSSNNLAQARPDALSPETPVPQPAAEPSGQPAARRPDPRHRMADDRPDIDEQQLQAAGIRVERGQRLVLLTDLPPTETRGLCDLADQLFARLEQDLGLLPPADDGSEFQVTGCVIADTERFVTSGLMPNIRLSFRHGRHFNYRFWMNAQDTAYYQRHLLLHEFTHCFMTCESGMTDIPPLWYIEGMAEYFATHQVDADGRAMFGIMPAGYRGFEGWGRISELQKVAQLDDAAQARRAHPKISGLPHVLREVVTSQQEVDYAWWWAVCWMLQHHPRYTDDFAILKTHRHRQPFLEESRRLMAEHKDTLSTDWLLFMESLESGFRADSEFQTAKVEPWQLQQDSVQQVTLDARLGWTPTGLQLRAGDRVHIQAEGRYAMNQPPEDWPCEPPGVSVEYVRNIPLGALVATVVSPDDSRILRRIPVGADAIVTAESDGTLWLQIADHSAERFNNSGHLSVALSPAD